jgi:hypothetical protein
LANADQAFLELKNQLATGEPPRLIDATPTPEDRTFWLHLSNDWLKLARDTTSRTASDKLDNLTFER